MLPHCMWVNGVTSYRENLKKILKNLHYPSRGFSRISWIRWVSAMCLISIFTYFRNRWSSCGKIPSNNLIYDVRGREAMMGIQRQAGCWDESWRQRRTRDWLRTGRVCETTMCWSSNVQQVRIKTLKPVTDDPSSPSKKLVRETRTKNSVRMSCILARVFSRERNLFRVGHSSIPSKFLVQVSRTSFLDGELGSSVMGFSAGNWLWDELSSESVRRTVWARTKRISTPCPDKNETNCVSGITLTNANIVFCMACR